MIYPISDLTKLFLRGEALPRHQFLEKLIVSHLKGVESSFLLALREREKFWESYCHYCLRTWSPTWQAVQSSPNHASHEL